MSIGICDNQPSNVIHFARSGPRPRTTPRKAETDGILDVLRQAMDALDDGVIVTDSRGVLLHANAAGRSMMAKGPLRLRNELLCASTPASTRLLQRAIADSAVNPGSRCLCVEGESAWLLLTIAGADGLSHANGEDREPVVVTVARRRGLHDLPSEEAVRAAFDLTPAEAKLAREVATGDGLQACAERLGITSNTARTHLKRIFDKTGVQRQAQLVRLILSEIWNTNSEATSS